MKLAPAEAKAIKFVLLLIGLSAAARWMSRPAPAKFEQSIFPGIQQRADSSPRPARAATPAVLNPNTASLAELDRLPGIGQTTARRIMEGRPYHTLDDLARVIGRKRASALARKFNLPEAPVTTAEPRATRKAEKEASVPAGPVNLNRASQAELETLPGVGPSLARRILAERQRRGRFRDWSQLDSVSGIGPALLQKLRQSSTL